MKVLIPEVLIRPVSWNKMNEEHEPIMCSISFSRSRASAPQSQLPPATLTSLEIRGRRTDIMAAPCWAVHGSCWGSCGRPATASPRPVPQVHG